MEEEYKTVRIFILTNINHPGRVNIGVAMWLIEFLTAGQVPVTRQGFIHCEQTTQLELSLKALINAFTKLKEPCSVLIYCDCGTVLSSFENSWFIQWQKDGWRNSHGNPVKYPELWEMLIGKIEPHIYAMRGGHHDYSDVMGNEIRKEAEKWQKASSSKGRTN
jgi:ribonuclease HI